MNNIVRPEKREDHPDLEPIYTAIEKGLGFLPNGILFMSRKKELATAFGNLFKCFYQFSSISNDLKWAIAIISSSAAGCVYCQAHFSHIASMGEGQKEKAYAAFEFETSPLYNDAERAALRFAFASSTSPADIKESHYNDLKKHYNEDSFIEISAIISICGFLNRWNSTMSSELENSPQKTWKEISSH